MTATSTQIESLMDYMVQNPELARGFVHSIEGRVKAKHMWENLSNRLNSLGGAVKTVQQWKKVWADKKYLAKKANAAARRSATGTGGGPPTAAILSHNDQMVISVMGDGFGEPDMPGCSVPAFPKPLEQPTPLPADNREREAHEATPPEQNSRPIKHIQGVRRLRRRVRNPAVTDREKIISLEENKINLMTGILQELRELNKSIKQIADKI